MKPDRPLRSIPLVLRLTAGILSLALVATLGLLALETARNFAGPPSLLWFLPQVVVGVCLTALFGYVAITGFPPTHLLPAAGDDWLGFTPRLRINPELRDYLLLLGARHPGLHALWVVLPPGAERSGARLLLGFAKTIALESLRADWDIRRRDVWLLIVDDDYLDVSSVWGRGFTGRFPDWRWQLDAPDQAHCRLPPTLEGFDIDDEPVVALRLWSR